MPERLLISDANILIDMEAGALVGTMFRLDYQFAVPDVLFEEELRERHGHLAARGLIALELSGDTMAQVFSLARDYGNRVSRNDLMALGLAVQECCTLLTGDRRLRQVAEERAVPVRGTLWLVEQMLHARILSPIQAADAYHLMRVERRRLPWKDIRRQLDAWRGGA